ncbi:MAG: hypothetical protein ABJA10_03395, partial [Aestuariivirga sp.]
MSVTYSPLLAWSLIWAFGAVVVAITAYSIYRGARGSLLRSACGALLFGALCNPVIHQDEKEPLTDVAVLVVDRTASQTIGNRKQQTDQVLADLQKTFSTLPNTELRVTTVTSDSTETSGGTRAFAALARAVSDIPQSRYAEMIYWHAVALINMKRVDEALPLFAKAFQPEPSWRELTTRVPHSNL